MKLLSKFINENSTIHFKSRIIDGNKMRLIIYVGEVNSGKAEATVVNGVAEVTYLKIDEYQRGNKYGTILLKRLCLNLIREMGIDEVKIKVNEKQDTELFRKILVDIGFEINVFGTNEALFTLHIEKQK